VQDHGASVAEVAGKFDWVDKFVAEFKIGGNLGIEMLVDADELKPRRTLIHWRAHDAAAHDWPSRNLRNRRKHRNGREHQHKSCYGDHIGETALTAHCFVLFRLSGRSGYT